MPAASNSLSVSLQFSYAISVGPPWVNTSCDTDFLMAGAAALSLRSYSLKASGLFLNHPELRTQTYLNIRGHVISASSVSRPPIDRPAIAREAASFLTR